MWQAKWEVSISGQWTRWLISDLKRSCSWCSGVADARRTAPKSAVGLEQRGMRRAASSANWQIHPENKKMVTGWTFSYWNKYQEWRKKSQKSRKIKISIEQDRSRNKRNSLLGKSTKSTFGQTRAYVAALWSSGNNAEAGFPRPTELGRGFSEWKS